MSGEDVRTSPHWHGCHADYGDCEAPFEHGQRVAARDDERPTCGVPRPSSSYSCLRPEGHEGEHRSHLSVRSYAYWHGTDGAVGYRSLPLPPEQFGRTRSSEVDAG